MLRDNSSDSTSSDSLLTNNKIEKDNFPLNIIFDNLDDPFFSVDLNYNYTFFNNSHSKLMKALFNVDIKLGKNILDYHSIYDLKERAKLNIDKSLKGEKVTVKESFGEENNRKYLHLIHSPVKNDLGKIIGVSVHAKDFTEIKLSQEQIEHLATFPNLNPNPIIEIDLDGNIKYYNKALITIIDQLNLTNQYHAFLPQDIDEIRKICKSLKEDHKFYEEIDVDKRIFGINMHFVRNLGVLRIYGTDLTERKKIESHLNKLSHAINQSPNTIVITDNKGTIEYVNPKFTEVTGYEYEEVYGLNPKIMQSGNTKPEVYRELWKTILSGKEWHGSLLNKKKDGELYWEKINISPVKDSNENITHFIAIKEDITQQKKQEEQLYRMYRTLNALRHSSEVILHSDNQKNIINNICKIIIEDCGHSMVWIGLALNNAEKTVQPIALGGFEKDYIANLKISWDDNERGRGPTGTAIRTGKPYICKDMYKDNNFKPWLNSAIGNGFRSSVALPMKTNNDVIGAITIYSKEVDAFSYDEVNLLLELANNLAYGISVLNLKEAKDIAESELRKHKDHLEELVIERTNALKFVNEVLEKAQEVANVGHWHYDLINNKLQWSNETCKIFGIEPKSFSGSIEEFFSLTHPDDLDKITEEYQRSLNNKEIFSIDHRIISPDGKIRFVHDRCTHYYNDKGPYSSLGIIKDITEQVLAQKEIDIYRNHLEELVRTRTEKLAITNSKLELEIEKGKQVEMLLKESLEKEKELNILKTRFISTTSHEFRTPLSSILSSMQLVQRYRKKWNDEELDIHFERIKKSVQHLTKLLDDILIISRSESGIISLNPEDFDLRKLCSNVYEEVKHLATINHKFTFIYECERDNYKLDKKLMQFILENLLSNAFKYSPNGGNVHFSVTGNVSDIQITISDEGIGIPSDDKKHLFEPFHRSKNTGDIPGTGLGLSIVHRAVEMHKGKIEYITKLNKGTKFIVNIPKVLL
ncbi:MAG TPA: PAS domain S-box protein [Ignavibacteriaceae bacterium]|nr:PAS domain S-box protein [Ignavibacteriaceae bacterium]